jgi:hypothetical protein
LLAAEMAEFDEQPAAGSVTATVSAMTAVAVRILTMEVPASWAMAVGRRSPPALLQMKTITSLTRGVKRSAWIRGTAGERRGAHGGPARTAGGLDADVRTNIVTY